MVPVGGRGVGGVIGLADVPNPGGVDAFATGGGELAGGVFGEGVESPLAGGGTEEEVASGVPIERGEEEFSDEGGVSGVTGDTGV